MKITFLLPLVLVFIVAVNSQSVSYWQQLVPLPSGLKNQGGYTYLKASTMLNLFGKPCALTPNCKSVTAPTLASQIQTRKIGKFTFTGMKKVLDALSRALNRVASENPSLYNALGSSGMLCCRAIRGSSTTFSNHAWGAAIDFNIGGKLDPRGDGKTQRGLLALWPYMKREGFYWAGGYSGSSEDAMHFEIANEVMLNWGRSGDWGSCTTTGGVGGRCIDVSQCNGQTQANRCPGPSNIKCCYSPSTPKKYKCVTATKLNVRSGPCTTYSILTTVQKNEALEVLSSTIRSGCSNNWVNVRVRRNGVAGHVSTSYVKDCVPSGANEFNNTLIDEPVNGTFFAEDDEGFDYESVEPPEEEVSMSSIVTPFLAVPLFFVIHLINRYVF